MCRTEVRVDHGLVEVYKHYSAVVPHHDVPWVYVDVLDFGIPPDGDLGLEDVFEHAETEFFPWQKRVNDGIVLGGSENLCRHGFALDERNQDHTDPTRGTGIVRVDRKGPPAIVIRGNIAGNRGNALHGFVCAAFDSVVRVRERHAINAIFVFFERIINAVVDLGHIDGGPLVDIASDNVSTATVIEAS
jgi:hypothetical protein